MRAKAFTAGVPAAGALFLSVPAAGAADDISTGIGTGALLHRFLGLSPLGAAWVAFGIWLAAGLAAAKTTGLLWNRMLLPLARRTKTTLHVRVLAATRGPARLLVFLAAAKIGSSMCFTGLSEVTGHTGWGLAQGVLYIALVLAITCLAYMAAKALTEWYAQELAARTAGRPAPLFTSLFRKLASIVFFFIALTIIFDHFGVQITGLLATAGVASLAVAFAAQETLANMIAGFVLMIDHPFRPGDRIQFAGGQVGDVLDIGLRSTRVLSFDNTVITVPNAEIAKAQIVNFSAPDPRFKIRCTLGVAYGTDLRKAKAILLEILGAHPEVLKDPEPKVFFAEFAESSLNLLFVCWVADYREQFRIRDELNMAIKDRFEEAGVQIPFPQRDLHLRASELAGLLDGARAPSAPGGRGENGKPVDG